MAMNFSLKKYKKHLYAFIIFIVSMLLFTVFGEKGLMTLNGMRGERDGIASDIQQLERDNMALKEEIEGLKTDRKYIATIARRELGMIGKNEVIYRFKE
ncbi:MAG: septum formation initiator family protein [Thermodesulfobacteriota bacterium]